MIASAYSPQGRPEGDDRNARMTTTNDLQALKGSRYRLPALSELVVLVVVALCTWCIEEPVFAGLNTTETETPRNADGESSQDNIVGERSDEFGDAGWKNRITSRGYFLQQTAGRINEPQRFTRVKQIFEGRIDVRFSDTVKARLSGRAFYDAAFDLTSAYSTQVKRAEASEVTFREAYLEVSHGDWTATLGSQQIVWGEMLGLFVADVVTAKDYRDFLLMDFEYMRIPRTGLNLQYYGNSNNLQVIWLPVYEHDRLARPSSEFSFFNQFGVGGLSARLDESDRPNRVGWGEVGVKWSTLYSGWNPSLFYYYAQEHTPAYLPVMTETGLTFQSKYGRVHQVGFTVSKDLNGVILRSEGVLSAGRTFARIDDQIGGFEEKTVYEMAIGASYNFPGNVNANLQFYRRDVIDKDEKIIDIAPRSTVALWLNPKIFSSSLNPVLFYMYDVQVKDWMFRASISYNVSDAWTITVGGDLFGGNEKGFWGQFNHSDRVYSLLRYAF